jgi:hypothetical protein
VSGRCWPGPVARRSASTRTSSPGTTKSVTLMLRSVMLDHTWRS